MKWIYYAVFSLILISTSFADNLERQPSIFYYSYEPSKDLYTFNDRRLLSDYSDQVSVLNEWIRRMEYEFAIEISLELLEQSDIEGNTIRGYIVNIDSGDKEIYELFQGPAHSSPIIETVSINILQPMQPAWFVDFIMLKVNGIFTDYLQYDSVYWSMVTTNMYRSRADYLFDFDSYPDDLKR